MSESKEQLKQEIEQLRTRVAELEEAQSKSRQTEKMLKKSEERLNVAQEIGHVGVWDWDLVTSELLWSDETYRILGLTPGECLPSFEIFIEAVHVDDRDRLNQAVEAAHHQHEPYDVDCRIVRKDGSEVVANAQGEVTYDADDKPIRMMGTFQDITERKRAESEIRRSAERFERWKSSNFIGILHSDSKGNIIDANDTLLAILGYSKQELTDGKLDWTKLTPPEFLDLDNKAMEEAAETGTWTPFEKEYFHKDGHRIPILIGGSVFVEAPDEYIVFVIDLSEQKMTENALRQSDRWLNSAQKIANIGHGTVNTKTMEADVSDEIFRIFDLERSEATPETFMSRVHPEDLELCTDRVRKGTEHGEGWDIEHRLIMSDGTVKNVNSKAEVEVNEAGEAVRLVGTIQDISDRKTTEQALVASERKYRQLAENLPAVVYQFMMSADGAFSVPYVNESVQQMIGVTAEDVMLDSAKLLGKVFPDDVEKFQAAILRSAQVLEPFEITFRYSKGEETRWTDVRSIPEALPDGGVLWNGYFTDVTERKRAEEALRESEERNRTYVENAPEGIFVANADRNYTEVNDAACTMTGYSRDELLTMSIQELVSPNTHPEALGAFARLKETGRAEVDVALRCKDGRDILVALKSVALGPDRFIAFCSDITERKQAEVSLRESEERFRVLFENAPLGYQSLDESGNFLELNDTYCRIMGYEKEELLGRNFSEILHPDFREHFKENFPKFKGLGYILGVEFEMIKKDGSEIIVSFDGKIGKTADGEFKQTHCVLRDETDRKRAEDRATRFHRVLHHSLNEIYLFDTETLNFVEVNRGAQENLGYSMEELRGMTPVDLKPEITDEEFAKMVEPLRAGIVEKIQFETVHCRKDGSLYPVEAHLQMVSEGEPLFVAILLDITERKEVEETLRLSAQKWRTTFDSMSDITCLLSPEHEFLEVNQAVCDSLGKTRDELLGRKCYELVHGTTAPIPECPCVNMAKDKQPKSSTYTQDGRHYELLAWPVLSDTEELSAYVHVVRDTTEHVELEEQLRQAQKMESVGRLAGGVAHDFNNMLGAILGHADLILDQVDPEQSVYTDVKQIIDATERSADLTKQLLAFARKQTVSPKVLDLNTTLDGMTKMLKRLIGEDIDLVWKPGKKLRSVRVDPSQVDQIIVNLCVNARDAIPDVGKITIETQNVVLDEDYCAERVGLTPGKYVSVSITDTGSGMTSETMKDIFEPFFTTKKVGEGTGLGLSTVYGIAKQNKGFVDVSSELGEGTIFTIYLPQHSAAVSQTPERGPVESDEPGNETILLVEDEPSILKLTTKILEKQGYNVVAARSPGEALSIAREHIGEIHLLMTDVVMPEMNGRDLAKNLLSFYPNTKCLYMSGYTADVIAHHGVLDDGVNFLQKPFRKKALALKVRKVLDRE